MVETVEDQTKPWDVAAALTAVTHRIDQASASALKPAETITLVAVSKAQPDERVHAALVAGHRVFGENRVQEAAGKWPDFKVAFPGVELHLIGPLQTNKVRDAVALFDVIESVDRPKLAEALAREMEKTQRRPDCLIQVNIGAETQKAGILPDQADAFIETCRRDLALPVIGLMCIPPVDEEPSPYFALLAEIAERHGLGVLSMGMSADFEIAIRFGATHVRVGTAIFGPRAPLPVTDS